MWLKALLCFSQEDAVSKSTLVAWLRMEYRVRRKLCELVGPLGTVLAGTTARWGSVNPPSLGCLACAFPPVSYRVFTFPNLYGT